MGLKGLGMAAKKIPVVGSLPALAFAASRAMEGDWVGASMEVASAASNLANVVAPGVGSAGALAIDAALMARDMGVIGNKGGSPKPPEGMQSMSKAARATQASRSQAPVIKGGKTEVTINLDKRPIAKVAVDTFNEIEQPSTPMRSL